MYVYLFYLLYLRAILNRCWWI